MDSDENGSSEDDGILDEDIPGGDDDNLLDDAELDYTEDILDEEGDLVTDDKPASPQEPVSVNRMYICCGPI